MDQDSTGMNNDTIIALATPYGVGAIAVIRLFGHRLDRHLEQGKEPLELGRVGQHRPGKRGRVYRLDVGRKLAQ